jgi:hypothetical protein
MLIVEGYNLPLDVLKYVDVKDDKMTNMILESRPYISLKCMKTSYTTSAVSTYIDSEGRNSLFYVNNMVDTKTLLVMGANSNIRDKDGRTFIQHRDIDRYTAIVDDVYVATLLSIDMLIDSNHRYHLPDMYRVHPNKVFDHLMKVDKTILATMRLAYGDHAETFCRHASVYEVVTARLTNHMSLDDEQCELAVSFLEGCYNDIALLAINKEKVLEMALHRAPDLFKFRDNNFEVYTGVEDQQWPKHKNNDMSYEQFDKNVRGVLNTLKSIEYKSVRMFKECAYRGIYLKYTTREMLHCDDTNLIDSYIVKQCASKTLLQYLTCGYTMSDAAFEMMDWNDMDDKIKIITDMRRSGCLMKALDSIKMMKMCGKSAISFARIVESYDVDVKVVCDVIQDMYLNDDVKMYVKEMSEG